MQYVLILAALVAVAVFVARLVRPRSQPPETPLELPPPQPRFKDFRHSGGTFEESQANYRAALERWQQQTGRTYDEDE
jgi:hypothetical protein